MKDLVSNKKEKFVYQYPDKLEKKIAKLNEAIDYLIILKKPSKIVESQSAYEAIFLIAKVIGFNLSDIY